MRDQHNDITIRQVTEADVPVLRTLSNACPPLGVHTAFTYWVICHYYAAHSYIAEINEQPVGYVLSISRHEDPDMLYVWQVGVVDGHRRSGVGFRLFEYLVDQARQKSGIGRFEISIEPGHEASRGLAQSIADAKGMTLHRAGEISFSDPLDDKAEHEYLFEMKV